MSKRLYPTVGYIITTKRKSLSLAKSLLCCKVGDPVCVWLDLEDATRAYNQLEDPQYWEIVEVIVASRDETD